VNKDVYKSLTNVSQDSVYIRSVGKKTLSVKIETIARRRQLTAWLAAALTLMLRPLIQVESAVALMMRREAGSCRLLVARTNVISYGRAEARPNNGTARSR